MRHQCVPSVRRNQCQNGIFRVGWITDEIGTSREALQDPAREYRNHKMRRLRNIGPTRNAAWLDRLKGAGAAVVARQSAESAKLRIASPLSCVSSG